MLNSNYSTSIELWKWHCFKDFPEEVELNYQIKFYLIRIAKIALGLVMQHLVDLRMQGFLTYLLKARIGCFRGSLFIEFALVERFMIFKIAKV